MKNNLQISPPTGKITTFLVLILFCTTFISFTSAQAQDENKEQTLSKLFQSHEPLKLRLESPFKKYLRQRGEERSYMESVLKYKDDAGNDVSVDLKVRVRGKYRAKKEICNFPPLKLNFSKNTTAGTIFEGEDKLKLVTHCRSSSRYEQYVLLEYLIYRMQNLLTDYSLRPRLATIEYFDSEANKVTDTKFGFLIEDKGKMAKRLGTEEVKMEKISRNDYDQNMLHMTAIFEYMLGNTDYSFVLGPPGDMCCHNIIPLKDSSGTLLPVAYDFDSTGFVNPPYVSPPEHLGIMNLRQRLYRGYCQNTDGFKQSFALFQEKKAEIYDLLNSMEGLNKKSIKMTALYLDNFYEAISNDDKINREFISKCRD